MTEESHDAGCGFSGRLSAFFDGELRGEERRTVEAHLKQCPSCAAELEAIASVSETLKGAYSPDASEGCRERLRASIPRGSVDTIMRLAEALTAVAATILVASLFYIAASVSQPAEAVRDEPSLAAASLEMAQPAIPESPEEEQLARYILADLSGEATQ